jgi:serine/threonine protein kinase
MFAAVLQVYRAVNRVTGEDVAIKAVSTRKLDKKALANLESEISILQGINHPNVVRLLDVQVWHP